MFQIYGIAGRVTTRSPELPGRVPPAAAVLPARSADPIGQGDERSPEVAAAEQGDRDTARTSLRSVYGDHRAAAHARPARTCGDLLVQPAAMLAEDTLLPQAWNRVFTRGLSHAWVLGATGQVSGVLLRQDLHALDPFGRLPATQDLEALSRLARDVAGQWRRWWTLPVRSFMRTPLPALLLASPLRQAAALLLSSQLPVLPVVDDLDSLLGELGAPQIVRALATDPPIDLWT